MDKGVSAIVVSAGKNQGFHLKGVDWWTLAPTLDIGVIVFKPQQKPLGEVKAPFLPSPQYSARSLPKGQLAERDLPGHHTVGGIS